MNAIRVRMLVAACFSSASMTFGANAQELVEFKKLPPVMKGVGAFPRLVVGAPSPVIDRVNGLLARADAKVRRAASDCLRGAPKGRADWTRRVSITMAGPRYISFLASDDFYCGGAHPDNSAIALVFDLTTGTLLDWGKLVPELAKKKGTDTAGDGSTVGTMSSSKLSKLYKEQASRERSSARHIGLDEAFYQSECAGELDEADLNFIAWPDAQQGGLVVQPVGLPHAVSACFPALVIPLEGLKSDGDSAVLLNAISAAHQSRQ